MNRIYTVFTASDILKELYTIKIKKQKALKQM